MKLVLVIALIMSGSNLYACDKNSNANYDFSYNLEKKIFTYKVTKKDRTSFSYYNKIYRNMPGEFGFVIEGNSYKKPSELNKLPLNLTKDQRLGKSFTDFYLEEGRLNSSMLYKEDNTYKIQPTEENYLPVYLFEKTSLINKSINIDSFISFFKNTMVKEDQYGVKKIKVKVKLVLDPNLKECLSFETPVLEYNFGNESWNRFKNFLK